MYRFVSECQAVGGAMEIFNLACPNVILSLSVRSLFDAKGVSVNLMTFSYLKLTYMLILIGTINK